MNYNSSFFKQKKGRGCNTRPFLHMFLHMLAIAFFLLF
jgi:hypothetical protein